MLAKLCLSKLCKKAAQLNNKSDINGRPFVDHLSNLTGYDVFGEKMNVVVAIGSRLFMKYSQSMENFMYGFTGSSETFGTLIEVVRRVG